MTHLDDDLFVVVHAATVQCKVGPADGDRVAPRVNYCE